MHTFDLPVGYHKLHPTKIIDFQLNRWYSMGYARLEDMRAAAANIKGLADWKDEMLRQADRASAEGRLMNQTFYIRAAEFFTRPQDPDKHPLYEQFSSLFYDELFPNEPFERHSIPYEGASLHALRIPAQIEPFQGTLLVHGGFDSFIEELYFIGSYFAGQGYEVLMFDGPGQGAVLKRHRLPMDYRWERPTAAVLDYFGRDEVTLLGISMGGWLCFRAAANEPRITRVIASSIAFDYMQIPPAFIADFARWLMKRPKLMNVMSEWKMQIRPQERWGIENLMYMTQTDTPLDASFELLNFNEENLQSDRVTQDVLILTGAEDHFIPQKMHHLQVAALTNARSITEHIFTQETQGHNHCQVGNWPLALQTMHTWLQQTQPAPQSETV